jgi:hypothetical protein
MRMASEGDAYVSTHNKETTSPLSLLYKQQFKSQHVPVETCTPYATICALCQPPDPTAVSRHRSRHLAARQHINVAAIRPADKRTVRESDE